MPALRQFPHGDCLSHRTFLCRHTKQLRIFRVGAEVVDPLTGEVALFSDLLFAKGTLLLGIVHRVVIQNSLIPFRRLSYR